MKKGQFRSQASSGRVGGGFGAFGSSGFGSASSSVLSYIQEPPDYSTISDSNTVVAFKSLSKKDSTTKAKALEDLQAALTGTSNDIEDAVVEAWIKQYPRLSIDNARRVRQLAHQLTGQVGVKCGKRIAKHLPRISGPWLAGTFDTDRSVSKTAQDALSSVFSSQGKINGLRRTFQEPIVEYCRDAVLNETVGTLSDERSVSVDDSKATYARVVSTSLAVIASLFDSLAEQDLAKQQHIYETILCNKKFWEFPHHEDPGVRKAAHRLVQICMKKGPAMIESNLALVSTAYVYKALAADQTGSSLDFIQTLRALTGAYPSIWTSSYSGKKPALARLRQGLKSGAHVGPPAYWEAMTALFTELPSEVLPTSYDEISDLFLAARDGVSRKEERFNASAAWPAYFKLVDVVTRAKPQPDAESLLEAFVLPAISQYIHPSEESSRWTIAGAKPALVVSKSATIMQLPPLLMREWPHLADKLVEVAKMSQPESSKDFEKSQKHVAASGERYAALQREFYSGECGFPDEVHAMFTTVNNSILDACISILKNRKGKPHGAAAIIEEQLRTCSTYLLRDPTFKSTILGFVKEEAVTMIFSPSQKPFTRCLFSIQAEPQFAQLFASTLDSVLQSDESLLTKLKALHALFPANTPQRAIQIGHDLRDLQILLASHAGTEEEEAQDLFTTLLKLGAVSTETSDKILSTLTESLTLSGASLDSGLSSLRQLTDTNEPIVRGFMSRDIGQKLLPSVLRLEQSPSDTIAESATSLASRLTTSIAGTASETKYGVLLQNLEKVSATSLPIDALVALASKVSEESQSDSKVQDILLGMDAWQDAILAVLKKPKASLALLSPLGGAVHLLREGHPAASKTARYDAEGLSQALRIAYYYAALFALKASLTALPVETSGRMLALLSICVLLAEDGTSILGAHELWQPSANQDAENEVMDFVSNANSLLGAQFEQVSPSHQSMLETLQQLQETGQQSPLAYYAALASVKVYDNKFETRGYSQEQTSTAEEQIKALSSAKNTLALVAHVAGHAQPLTNSQVLTRMCNEAVADLTGMNLKSDESKALDKLILLNCILHHRPETLDSIAKPRLVFLIKHILPWLQDQSCLSIKSEATKALTSLLPGMSDMYGEHWSQMIEALVTFWKSSASHSDGDMVSELIIPLTHASLKLYAALRKLADSPEANDDLLEALKENEKPVHLGLISLLQSASGIADDTHQPLMVTNELLARQISQLPQKPLEDAEDMFSLLYTPSQAIQGAAFDLLHKHIPQAQEQISFDAALDDKTAQLPDELLSLVIEPPTLQSLADASFDITMPLSLQGYLYSWRLIFDHFTGSSYKVKNDYVEHLREGGYLNGLLELTFDFLGHNHGRPIDASAYDLSTYEPGMESSPEKEVRSLLCHLYYLSLARLPSLVKNFVNNEIRSRQAPKTIETWTAKYISPLIIDSSLQEVAQWAEKIVKDDPDYEAMSVKVNMRGREVYVGYQVDEQTMAMKIVLPEAYPLQIAKPESVNRVAVSEQKWRGWLMNCQGTITFSVSTPPSTRVPRN